MVMDNRNEIREFLTSRRARNTPERADLPAYQAEAARATTDGA